MLLADLFKKNPHNFYCIMRTPWVRNFLDKSNLVLRRIENVKSTDRSECVCACACLCVCVCVCVCVWGEGVTLQCRQ
jgi:hypothetical protein